MERTTIANGIVVTLDDDDTVLVGGTVVLEDDKIAYVGPADKAPLPAGKLIDASGKAVMPGLVDLHYHTAIAKGWSDHLPLWEYLDTLWYPAIRALDDETAYWAALASYCESIKCGVTTVNDMYRRLEGLATAAEEIGIRAVLSNDIADPEHDLDSLDDTRAAYAAKHKAGGGRIEIAVGIEWLPMASEQLLRDARGLADELGIKFHIHLNESMTEVDNSLERFGRRPTEVAYDCGVLGPDCIAAHCVWLSDREISLMAETGTHISHNPGSNAKLGNGVARLPEMLEAGINVGLGHDAAECNNSRDLFETIKLASIIHRAVRQDASLGPTGRHLAHGDAQRRPRPRPRDRPPRARLEGGPHPHRPVRPDVRAPARGAHRAALLAPRLRRQRQLCRHDDHRRQGRHGRPEDDDHRRGARLCQGQ